MSEPNTQKIRIANETYEVLDALNNITLADSFVKNKTGTGHGEAKLLLLLPSQILCQNLMPHQ